MNIKYLLPVVAGLAMTACSSEDDFLTNSSNGLKESPVTFSFVGEDPASRAIVGDGQSVVTFEEGDLTSLFNALASTTPGTWDNFTNNAVYEAKSVTSSDAGASVLEFSTASMVRKGEAVMVYPADLCFDAEKAGAIYLKVARDQDAETKENAPYVTDVLSIAEHNHNSTVEQQAGYGKNYPIAFKKVANTWRLDLNALNKELIENATVDGTTPVAPIAFEKALIEANDDAAFNTSVQVVASVEDSKLNTNKPGQGFEYVKKQTAFVDGTTSRYITSTDFENHSEGESFTFTVLPKNTVPAFTSATVLIYTNYGKVRVDSKDIAIAENAVYPLIKADHVFGELETTYNMAEYLYGMLENYQTSPEGTTYAGEKVGSRMKRIFTFDLKTLDMNELDIVDSEHLINVLSVYKALGLTSAIELNLKTPNANKEFELTKAALDKLAEVNAAGNITLDDDQYSNIITLTNGCVEEFNNAAVVVNGGEAHVKLYGTLSLAQNTSTRKMESLEVAEGATLTLTPAENLAVGIEPAWVPFAYNPEEGLLSPKSVPFSNNGTLKLDGKIYVGGLRSEGAVVIPQGSSLYTSGETTLQGTVENKGSLTSYNGNLINLATIDNYGDITTSKSNIGTTLVNGGIINMMNDDAILYITKNVAYVNSAYYIGEVNLNSRDNEVKIEKPEMSADEGYRNGYIKYTLTAAEDIDVVSESTDKFNFLVVNATTNLVKVNLDELTETVQFLQITGEEANIIRTETAMVLRDLIIDSSMRWLSANQTLTVKGKIYVGGIFKHAGNVSGTQSKSYTSNTWGVATDNTTYAKGEIKNTIGM